MGIYYAVGNALVSDEELREKQTLQNFNFESKMDFRSGQFDPKIASMGLRDVAGELVEFVEIGIGKPLIVELREVYTGKFPDTRRPKDMLVTSAMKSIAAYNGAPRAINYLLKNIGRSTSIDVVPAPENGTSLIFYSPALMQYNSNITVEFGFDEFDPGGFDIVSNLFQSAAGLPIFAASSTFLMAAGAITKIAGRVGSLLADKTQQFASTDQLYLLRAGQTVARAGFILMTDDRNDFNDWEKQNFSVNKLGKLVNQEGAPYKGDKPYAIISYDGRESDEYKKFTATQASAELLEQFYSVNDRRQASADILLDALKLHNDLRFRDAADEKTKEIAGLDKEKDKAKIEKLKVERQAAVDNITNDLFKPKIK